VFLKCYNHLNYFDSLGQDLSFNINRHWISAEYPTLRSLLPCQPRDFLFNNSGNDKCSQLREKYHQIKCATIKEQYSCSQPTCIKWFQSHRSTRIALRLKAWGIFSLTGWYLGRAQLSPSIVAQLIQWHCMRARIVFFSRPRPHIVGHHSSIVHLSAKTSTSFLIFDVRLRLNL